MGKYLDKFKNLASKTDRKLNKMTNKPPKNNSNNHRKEDDFDDDFDDRYDDFNDKFDDDFDNRYDEVGIQPSQKPESFHHFILDNQYRDLERSIRGYKDIYDKRDNKWITVRKKEHCFTDEEAEDILRTAQSHLATDIKLGRINKESFPILMDAIYQELAFLFESIAEYRYGRYGPYEKQYDMKLQNHKIFLELFSRIQANYSRAIGGMENQLTHDSVKGQESLQNTDRDLNSNKRYS